MADGSRWPLRRVISFSLAALTVFLLAAVVFGGFALAGLGDARERVVGHIDPALQHALRLESALVDQESGVHSYALGADEDVLTPYTAGIATEEGAVSALGGLLADLPDARGDLAEVGRRAERWRSEYAQPTIGEISQTDQPAVGTTVAQGKQFFDAVRAALNELQNDLNAAREAATESLDAAAVSLNATLIASVAAFALIIVGLAIGLRRGVIQPVSRLAEDVRTVADGDFGHSVEQHGPREVRALAADVNRMRERILSDLSAVRAAHDELDARTKELERSNSELEQFAYVASHDLQEPLRKVASFCQLLERRYQGKLDERADQYIGFAVDGAKRMQILINDLLAFSRVGRIVRESERASCATMVAQAVANLSDRIEQTDAVIEYTDLPTVSAEVPLLTAVFQNLISNALKFHGEEAPHVRIDAVRSGEMWQFSVADNGIGIAPEYAERIFVIFQRLHNKADYPGTGIGLAMCRKIIEYHGGTIWLDTTVESGSRFCFTLPVLDSDVDTDTEKDADA